MWGWIIGVIVIAIVIWKIKSKKVSMVRTGGNSGFVDFLKACCNRS